jgi:3-deoxy-manno-octulosonate cytidylyltransferase (CMP-KDO synthetase)
MPVFLAIIPARYASTRFPGKPLVEIGGKTMIQHVFERAGDSMERVIVATDDERIALKVRGFGGEAIMTSSVHQSGTDRCAEALQKYEQAHSVTVDVVVNIQGDEPFIRKEQIDLLKCCFEDSNTQIATLIKIVGDNETLFDTNRTKAVVDKNGFALYFSRSVIPFLRNPKGSIWQAEHNYYQHIGMYAYRSITLREITRLPQGLLEKAESLEQLRWLENGYRIKTAVTDYESLSIDTPEDLEKALKSKFFKD